MSSGKWRPFCLDLNVLMYNRKKNGPQIDHFGTLHSTVFFIRFNIAQYSDVVMSAMASQITGVSIVCSTVCSGVDQRKHQSYVSLAFVRGIHRWPVYSPSQRSSNAANFSISWWCRILQVIQSTISVQHILHHVIPGLKSMLFLYRNSIIEHSLLRTAFFHKDIGILNHSTSLPFFS